jgi:hypothetical protein
LGSGLIGHFAVNPVSGEVINIDAVRVEHGPRLDDTQATVRREHCISATTVRLESNRFPSSIR